MKLLKKVKQYIIDLGIYKNVDDKEYLKKLYKRVLGKELDLDNPKTFNEKIQWLKIYDRKDIYNLMVDKYEAKLYVGNIIGHEFIVPNYGVWNSFKDIDFNNLPNKFVLKCTHDSGGSEIVKNKANMNKLKMKLRFNLIMKRNYYYRSREWVYKNIKPRIIAEQVLENDNNEELRDYKFMCFNGKVKCSFVCSDRNKKGQLKVDFFDLNWNKMPFIRKYPNSDKEIPKPKNYKKMIELAEKLAQDIPFVRVDFYEVNDKVFFGEMTFFPGSGLEAFFPECWDRKLGDLINLDVVK